MRCEANSRCSRKTDKFLYSNLLSNDFFLNKYSLDMKYAHIVETSIQLMPILIPVELYNLWNIYLYQESRIDSVDGFDFSMPTSSKKNIRNFDAYVVKVRYKLVVFFIIEYTQLRFYLLIKIQKNIRHSFPSVDMENFSTTRPPLILDNMFLKNSVD